MLASRQSTVSSLRRDAWVEVDLAALEANVNVIRSWLNGANTKLMAVVKSDAYGHGASGLVQVLTGAGAEWMAVASVDEGCQLRGVDGKTPVLILSPAPSWAIGTAVENSLDLTVTSNSQLKDINAAAKLKKKKARVHLKIDTGMHRLGASPADFLALVEAAHSSSHLDLISIFSHLAKADELEFTKKQDDCFRAAIASISNRMPGLLRSNGGSVLAHLASGEAARRHPFSHHDMVRVGLYLYGLESRKISDVVKPALSIRGRINQVSEIEAGESAGYNLTWTASQKTRLASIPIGYADGVDRGLSNKMTALLMGKEIKQIGIISMDQMLFDITPVPEAREGDVITLIGQDGEAKIYLADWGEMLDTITYELACRMRVRLPRIYTRHALPMSI